MGCKISPVALGVAGLLAGGLALLPPAARADDSRGLEIGILGGFTQPDGDLQGAGKSDIEPSFGARIGWVPKQHFGFYVDALYTEIGTATFRGQADEISTRLGADYLFGAERPVRWFLTGGIGFTTIEFDGATDFTSAFASAGFGQRIRVSGRKKYRWELRADHTLADAGLSNDRGGGDDVIQLRFLFGLNWGPGNKVAVMDADRDTIPDSRDRCPGTPLRALVDSRGCPLDTDADGVFDGIDRCASTPAGATVDSTGCLPDEDADGVPDADDSCPATAAGKPVDERGCRMDADRDGVDDALDMCPDTPESVGVSASGCPRDSDADGVYDGIDRCPDTPRGVTVDTTGCARDADGDGVFDGIDRCAETPAGVSVGADGCRIAAPMFETRDTFTLEGVSFELNSADLTAESIEVLDQVVAALSARPEVRVEIAGHTDSQGSSTYNSWLSSQRAKAVLDYLVRRGVDPGRLEARGYGDSLPVESNETAAGRARNRRVELVRID